MGHCERMCECGGSRQCRGVPSLLLPLALCPPGCSGAFQLGRQALWEGSPPPPGCRSPRRPETLLSPTPPCVPESQTGSPAHAATCSHHVPSTWHVISSTCGGHLGAKTSDLVTGAAPHLPQSWAGVAPAEPTAQGVGCCPLEPCPLDSRVKCLSVPVVG